MTTLPTKLDRPIRAYPECEPPPPCPAAAGACRRIASNFAFLSVAEVLCRATSVFVTLSLTERLGRGGFGRIEFGFNVVFWLVLIVRDGLEVIAAREMARHPQLVRPLVNHILASKLILASILYACLAGVSYFTVADPEGRGVLLVYGLLLFTTAFGLDFAYRGIERMGLVAVSLVIRTMVYAVGVLLLVRPGASLIRVPLWLVAGEAVGILLVWAVFTRTYGFPRPWLGGRFVRVILRRGKPVLAIYLAQTVLTTVDLMVVGFLSTWTDSGLYSAPQRLIAAVLTLGVIFQQVVFPTLSRSWRMDADQARRTLDRLVQLFTLGFLPMAVGATVLAPSIVAFLFPKDYHDAAILLAIGIWRAPLLTMAFLYQAALIALNREAAAARFLFASAGLAPFAIVVGLKTAGLPGASLAMVLVSAGLFMTAYGRLHAERRAPALHHHLGYPIVACSVMVAVAIPLVQVHILAAVAGGALAYFLTLLGLGGVRLSEIHPLFRVEGRA